MPLAMRKKVFITAALTGSGGTQDRSDKVPRSPEQIANDAIEAAKAGRCRCALSRARPRNRERPRAMSISTVKLLNVFALRAQMWW
jgi:uncharacterized protein (DUF849 family)